MSCPNFFWSVSTRQASDGKADHREAKPFTEADVAKEDLSFVDGNSCPKRMPQVAMGQIRRRAIAQSLNPSNAHQA